MPAASCMETVWECLGLSANFSWSNSAVSKGRSPISRFLKWPAMGGARAVLRCRYAPHAVLFIPRSLFITSSEEGAPLCEMLRWPSAESELMMMPLWEDHKRVIYWFPLWISCGLAPFYLHWSDGITIALSNAIGLLMRARVQRYCQMTWCRTWKTNNPGSRILFLSGLGIG